jgi:hypothetical protein
MLAMNQRTYDLIGPNYPGNRAVDVKNPSLGWMIWFLSVVTFLGLFSLVALHKVFVQCFESLHSYVYEITCLLLMNGRVFHNLFYCFRTY